MFNPKNLWIKIVNFLRINQKAVFPICGLLTRLTQPKSSIQTFERNILSLSMKFNLFFLHTHMLHRCYLQSEFQEIDTSDFICLFNFMMFEILKKASTIKKSYFFPFCYLEPRKWFYAQFYCLANINTGDISIVFIFFLSFDCWIASRTSIYLSVTKHVHLPFIVSSISIPVIIHCLSIFFFYFFFVFTILYALCTLYGYFSRHKPKSTQNKKSNSIQVDHKRLIHSHIHDSGKKKQQNNEKKILSKITWNIYLDVQHTQKLHMQSIFFQTVWHRSQKLNHVSLYLDNSWMSDQLKQKIHIKCIINNFCHKNHRIYFLCLNTNFYGYFSFIFYSLFFWFLVNACNA